MLVALKILPKKLSAMGKSISDMKGRRRPRAELSDTLHLLSTIDDKRISMPRLLANYSDVRIRK